MSGNIIYIHSRICNRHHCYYHHYQNSNESILLLLSVLYIPMSHTKCVSPVKTFVYTKINVIFDCRNTLCMFLTEIGNRSEYSYLRVA